MKNYTFVPDQELIDFADDFSKNYNVYTCGLYTSKNGFYKIQYNNFDTFRFFRIGHDSKIIEINKFDVEKLSPDFVFYAIMWCVVVLRVKESGHNDKILLADNIAMKYYLTTNRSRKNIALGIINLFEQSSNIELNKRRVKLMFSMLTNPLSKIKHYFYRIKRFFCK